MKMRVADFLTNKLYEAGGEHVFLITGGMIMHLTDALLQHGKQKFIAHRITTVGKTLNSHAL